MPTFTTVDATWVNGVSNDDAELRRADTTMFLGDGSNNGVRGGIVRHGDNSLAVTVNGSDQVTIQPGAWVIPAATGLGVYRGALQAAVGPTAGTAIATRNATNPRIDLVVVQAPGIVKTIEGTPSSSPVAPAVPAQHIEVARLNVPAVGGGAVTVDLSWRTYAAGLGGTLYVATPARFPGSGNLVGQRAVALSDGSEHKWNGTAWVADESDSALTATPNVVYTANARCYRRGRMAFVNFEATHNVAIVGGTVLGMIPAGYRPPVRVYASALDSATGNPTGLSIQTTGEVFAVAARASGSGTQGGFSYAVA